MLFNSVAYFIFLPIAILLFYICPHKYRWAVLLALSYYFYVSWNLKLIWLILFTTTTSYLSALFIEKTENQKMRKLYLFIGVSVSLLCLFFFKYYNFFAETVTHISNHIGSNMYLPFLNVILPVGISFYTFQTLSYVIDIYNRRYQCEKHFGIYALYVSFFPQLVAGPIERASNLLHQFHEEKEFDIARTSEGLRLMGIGFIKKVAIADTVAIYVNNVYNDITAFKGLSLIMATFLFSIQIYCDFSGYSDIAIGTAKIFDIDLMTNFKSPYLSKSIKEFWRRWHISLSTWFTDYVYIPLGGSRVNKSRHYFNLIVTFFLSGLWHGANYTFVIWGLLFGIALCIENIYLSKLEKFLENKSKVVTVTITFIRRISTIIVVNAGWIFFRANNINDAIYVFKNLRFGLNIFRLPVYTSAMGISNFKLVVIAIMIILLFLYDWYEYNHGNALEKMKKLPPVARYIIYWCMGMSVLLAVFFRPAGVAADFIYFQF